MAYVILYPSYGRATIFLSFTVRYIGLVITIGSTSASNSFIPAFSKRSIKLPALPSQIGSSFPSSSITRSVISAAYSADKKCSIVCTFASNSFFKLVPRVRSKVFSISNFIYNLLTH